MKVCLLYLQSSLIYRLLLTAFIYTVSFSQILDASERGQELRAIFPLDVCFNEVSQTYRLSQSRFIDLADTASQPLGNQISY